MKVEDNIIIENELGIVLPESYKKVALEAKLANTKALPFLYDDIIKIINTNKRLREKGILQGQPILHLEV